METIGSDLENKPSEIVCNIAEEVFNLTGRLFCQASTVPSLVLDSKGRVLAANKQFINFFSAAQPIHGRFLGDVFYKGKVRDNNGGFLSPALESLYIGLNYNLVQRPVLGRDVLVFSTAITGSKGYPLGVISTYFPLHMSRRKVSYLSDYIRQVIRLKDWLGNRDVYTMSHSELVGWLSFSIASDIGLRNKLKADIFFSGTLHDIGKSYIPIGILNKKGPLSRSERQTVKKHPIYSYEILSENKHLKVFRDTVKYHHEYYDGNGYPKGLKGDNIPLASRILAVADAFEAMTANRPYRRAKCIAQACEELKKNSGTQFDPVVVDAFLALVAQHCQCYKLRNYLCDYKERREKSGSSLDRVGHTDRNSYQGHKLGKLKLRWLEIM